MSYHRNHTNRSTSWGCTQASNVMPNKVPSNQGYVVRTSLRKCLEFPSTRTITSCILWTTTWYEAHKTPWRGTLSCTQTRKLYCKGVWLKLWHQHNSPTCTVKSVVLRALFPLYQAFCTVAATGTTTRGYHHGLSIECLMRLPHSHTVLHHHKTHRLQLLAWRNLLATM